ncbi:trypsin-like peptidase domain-containing protein [archaeon]|nr:trypsin-like peptidase domain-containing protein [archaeon]
MKDIQLFTICIVLIAGLGVGGFYYHSQVTQQLINDYTIKVNTLNKQIEDFKFDSYKKFNEQKQSLSSAQQKIDYVEKKLDVKSLQLTQDLESKTALLENNIASVKDESQQQIEELTGQIKKVELTSVSGLNDLKDQLGGLGVSEDFASIIEQVLPSVVSINAGGGVGSGSVYRSNGYIVTNKHVVGSLSTVTVKTFDQKQYTANVIGVSATKDVAVIKINTENIPYLSFEDSANAKIGEKVIALGSPGGLDFSVTEGIISALNRVISGVNHFQTDVSINPGNSGGPLVNKAGKIMGMNTMKVAGYEGVGFAISSNEVQSAINEIGG